MARIFAILLSVQNDINRYQRVLTLNGCDQKNKDVRVPTITWGALCVHALSFGFLRRTRLSVDIDARHTGRGGRIAALLYLHYFLNDLFCESSFGFSIKSGGKKGSSLL